MSVRRFSWPLARNGCLISGKMSRLREPGRADRAGLQVITTPAPRRRSGVLVESTFDVWTRQPVGRMLRVGVEGTLHEHRRALFHRHGGGEPVADGCNRLV